MFRKNQQPMTQNETIITASIRTRLTPTPTPKPKAKRNSKSNLKLAQHQENTAYLTPSLPVPDDLSSFGLARVTQDGNQDQLSPLHQPITDLTRKHQRALSPASTQLSLQSTHQDQFNISSPSDELHRPRSRISLSSTSNLFQRIRAGMSIRGNSSSSLVSHLERRVRSTSSVYSERPELKSPAIPTETQAEPAKSTSAIELRNRTSLFSIQPSCSDSSSQHRSTMEELRISNGKQSTENNPTSRSYSDLGGLGIYHDPIIRPNSSCHYHRETFEHHQKPLNEPRTLKTSTSTIPRPTPAPKTQPNPNPKTAQTTTKSKILEKFNDEETEQDYLNRLCERVPRSKIPSTLASSNQPFHLAVLTKFMATFEFSHDPIDLSMRKLLMSVDLPQETQQIDRVIECFAKRYTECNPKLFKDPDQVYVLAFSIIMLHTDAFNKSNKAKMSRADYVRNTKMDGITTELLEYIYDNITYTPFIYVESNDKDLSRPHSLGPHHYSHDHTATSLFSLGSNGSVPASPRVSPGPNNFKIRLDPYQWISQGWTHELRPDLGSVIPSRNPFSFTGSVSWFDFKRLRNSFSSKKSVMIQIVSQAPYKLNSIFKQIESEDFLLDCYPLDIHQQQARTSSSFPRFSAKQRDHDTTNSIYNSTDHNNHSISPRTQNIHYQSPDGYLNLRAIKVGLIHLKVDLPFLISAKDSQSHLQSNLINESNLNRNVITKKWKLFCVILTAGQLILIKDFGLIGELQQSIKLAGLKNQSNPDDQLVVRITGLKPDVVFSLDGAIALMDSTYKRRPCTFRLILSKNLSILMALNDNDEMDSWITHINYAAAHKTHRIEFRSFDDQPSRPVSIHHSAHEHHANTPNPAHATSLIDSKDRRSFESLLGIHKSSRHSTDRPPLSRSASISNMLSRSQEPRPTSFIGLGSSPVINNYNRSKSPTRLSTISYGSSIPTQYDLVRAAILNVEAQLHSSKKELNEDLRLARNLAVLTPFQLSTRSRLHQAIIPIADRVRSSRCLLSKLACYREILIRDFPTALLDPSSINHVPSTTKLNSSVLLRTISPTRISLDKQKKESTVTTANTQWSEHIHDNRTLGAGTAQSTKPLVQEQVIGRKRQNSVGAVIDLNSSNLSKRKENHEIKNRRASLGDHIQRVSSIENNNKFDVSFFKQKGTSKRSIELNDNGQPIDLDQKHPSQQQQRQRRRSGSSIMSCGISAVKSLHSPLTSLRKSCDLTEVRIPHLRNESINEKLVSAVIVEPTPSNNITETKDVGTSKPQSIDRDHQQKLIDQDRQQTSTDHHELPHKSIDHNDHQQKLDEDDEQEDEEEEDDDDEIIRNTTLRKVGRHQNDDYSDFRQPNYHNKGSEQFINWNKASTINSTSASISKRSNRTSSFTSTTHSNTRKSLDRNKNLDTSPKIPTPINDNNNQDFSCNKFFTTPAPSYRNFTTSQSLSRSFSKFPKGFLSSSSKRSLNQTPLLLENNRNNNKFNNDNNNKFNNDNSNKFNNDSNNKNSAISGSGSLDSWKIKRLDNDDKNKKQDEQQDEQQEKRNEDKEYDETSKQTALMINLHDHPANQDLPSQSQSHSSPITKDNTTNTTTTTSTTPSTNKSRMMMKAKLAWNRNSNYHHLALIDPFSLIMTNNNTNSKRMLSTSSTGTSTASTSIHNSIRRVSHVSDTSSHELRNFPSTTLISTSPSSLKNHDKHHHSFNLKSTELLNNTSSLSSSNSSNSKPTRSRLLSLHLHDPVPLLPPPPTSTSSDNNNVNLDFSNKNTPSHSVTSTSHNHLSSSIRSASSTSSNRHLFNHQHSLSFTTSTSHNSSNLTSDLPLSNPNPSHTPTQRFTNAWGLP